MRILNIKNNYLKIILITISILYLVISFNSKADVIKKASENQIMAIILLKAVNYIQWPSYNSDSNLLICLLGDGNLNETIKKFNNKTTQNKTIKVLQITNKIDLKSCNVIYVGNSKALSYNQILSEKNNYFTVSDIKNFSRDGGIMEFYTENGRVSFKINLTTSRKNGFVIGSHLLRMGKTIK